MDRKALIEKAKSFLRSRKISYRHTFNIESVYAKDVMADLAKFCRADRTTFHADPRAHAVMEGRREVFLRIQHHLQLTDDQLWAIYGSNK